MKKGYFITFEGGDGSGKSTQIGILKEYLEGQGYDVILTREPGGTAISEKIREIILDPESNEMSDITETMLYAAARAQLVDEVIKPAVEAGRIVICDRFVDSSIAYQAYGRELGDCVNIINSYAVAGCMPDLTILLKVDPNEGRSRIESRKLDRIERASEEFHSRVYEGYLELEREFPERITGINANGTIEEIAALISKRVKTLLEE